MSDSCCSHLEVRDGVHCLLFHLDEVVQPLLLRYPGARVLAAEVGLELSHRIHLPDLSVVHELVQEADVVHAQARAVPSLHALDVFGRALVPPRHEAVPSLVHLGCLHHEGWLGEVDHHLVVQLRPHALAVLVDSVLPSHADARQVALELNHGERVHGGVGATVLILNIIRAIPVPMLNHALALLANELGLIGVGLRVGSESSDISLARLACIAHRSTSHLPTPHR